MNEQDVLEFQAEYEKKYAPELPEHLRDYRFRACLREAQHRETWLLEDKDGTRVICKHATGSYTALLHTEWEIKKFPFFPVVIDYHETGTEGWLLREYIEGDTLEELVEKNGPVSPERAREVVRQLGRCLLQLHHSEPPIIYRDLKPSNVVLTKAGEYYLIDLGSVRSFQEGSERDTVLVGTAVTAAPEQYGARQTDARTDIYALGILYAYLLNGELKKPDDARFLPDGPEAAIIRKATSFDPDNRYQSAEEFLRALDAPKASGRRGWRTAALVALSAAAVCGLLVLGLNLRTGNSAGTGDNAGIADGVGTADNAGIADGVGAGDSVGIADSIGSTDGTGIRDAVPTESSSETGSGVVSELSTDEVEFTSDLLRRAVCSALGKEDGEAVTYEDLKQINHLYVCGDQVFEDYDTHGYPPYAHRAYDPLYCSFWSDPVPSGDICDLSLLAHMKNLHELVLDFQQITDISPLAGLPLTRVSLCGNPITDLAPLENCSYLSSLAIDDTRVSSLAPLEGLRSLATLSITRSDVDDLTPVSGCPIAYLTLGNNPLTDYECLRRMPLVTLACQNLSKDALAPLSEVKSLTYLNLFACNIQSLEELAGFDSVTDLDLINNAVRNLKGIANLKSLRHIGLPFNGLTSLEGLEDADNLQKLELSVNSNPVEDFSALTQISELKQLGIDADVYDRLLETIPDPWFEVVVY